MDAKPATRPSPNPSSPGSAPMAGPHGDQVYPPWQLNHNNAATRQLRRTSELGLLITGSALRLAKSNALAHNAGLRQLKPNALAYAKSDPKVRHTPTQRPHT